MFFLRCLLICVYVLFLLCSFFYDILPFCFVCLFACFTFCLLTSLSSFTYFCSLLPAHLHLPEVFLEEVSLLSGLSRGGDKFCTTIDTLTQREPHSMLAAMFSGRHTVCKDSEGSVFLDRDGKHFRHILNWLRGGVVPNLSDSECSELLWEAEYYQLLGLVDEITEVLNQRREDEKMGTDLTRTDIIKYVAYKKGSLTGVNLSGLDLSKLYLSGVDFSYACLKNVFFSHANLQGASFWNANLTNANLEGANLERAYLVEANLKGAKLTNANLKGADLQYAYLIETDLEGAKLDGANLVGAYR